MVNLTLRRWHALTAMMALAVCARTVPIDAATSAGPEPIEAIVLDTATGATCDPRAPIVGPAGSVPFAASNSGMSLSISALEVHFVAEMDQAWEDIRVQVQFWDDYEPVTSALSELPPQATREVSLGSRQFFTRTANREIIRFQQPVTLSAASLHAVVFGLQGKLNGVWLDTSAFIPCLRSVQPGGPSLSGASHDPTDTNAVVMLKVFGAWLTPPPTLPPIPKATDTPAPAPPLAIRTFVPVVQR